MNCSEFRDALTGGDQTSESLAHLRQCEACLTFASTVDPDLMFRGLGTEDLAPEGGVELFVSEVMQHVRTRDAERSLRSDRRTVSPLVRWSVAAALMMSVGSAVLIRKDPAHAPVIAASVVHAIPVPSDIPVIENYENASATILEMPAENADDIKLVMIFDESLPVDL